MAKSGNTSDLDSSSIATLDVIDMIEHDHRRVEALFESFETATGAAEKIDLVQRIGNELLIHAQAEQEEFYTAVLGFTEEEELVDEALVEHAALVMLLLELDGKSPDDALFEARVKVLQEYVQHHVREEEGEILPAMRATEADFAALGRRFHARKQQLMAERDRLGDGAIGARVTLPLLRALLQAQEPARAAPTSGSRAQSRTRSQGNRARDADSGKRKRSGSARNAGARGSSRSNARH